VLAPVLELEVVVEPPGDGQAIFTRLPDDHHLVFQEPYLVLQGPSHHQPR
jgi:hypothetical protein